MLIAHRTVPDQTRNRLACSDEPGGKLPFQVCSWSRRKLGFGSRSGSKGPNQPKFTSRLFRYPLGGRNSTKCWTRGLELVLLLAIISYPAAAQNFGSIVGTVTDPTGAAVPGVKLTISSQLRGITLRTTVTNGDGNYAVPGLPPSVYVIAAEHAGFKMERRSSITLSARSTVRVDFTLSLGSVTQQVLVTAPAVHLQTETGTRGQTISGTEVSSVDTNGRSVIQLATLMPGAASQLPSFNVPVGPTSNTSISFNGEEPDHNVWSIDGVEDYDRGCGGCIVVVPDQAAVQEFKVETSNMGESTGFATGGQIAMVLKSGTDQFHGEAFEFNRNTSMAASTFFANATGAAKPTLIFNDFGFNIGGPIYIPGHQKKTFFFFEADWRDVTQGQTIVAPGVPVPWTQGNFSGYASPILNHSNSFSCPGKTSLTCYQPFPGNLIPTSMVNSNAQILGKPNFILPSPNSSGNLYAATPPAPIRVPEQIVRIDHKFSDKTSVMFHFIKEGVHQNFATTLWSGDTYPTVGTLLHEPTQQDALSITRSISPTLLDEFTVGFMRNVNLISPTGTYVQPSGLSIRLPYAAQNTDNRIPTISLYGPALGTQYDVYSWPWKNVINTWTFRDSLSKMSGNHMLNFGAEYMHYLKAQELFGWTQGNFTFNGSETGGNYVGPSGQILNSPGNEFADFMLGDVYSFTELQQQTYPAYLNNLYGVWAGDTWKIRTGLNLDLGLRWEGMPHVYEQHNEISVFRPSLYNPAEAPQLDPSTGAIIPGTGNLLNGIGIAGQNGVPPGMVDNHWALFEPRLGFAWRPASFHNTVIRGGYGLFYENIQGNDVYNVAPNPPFSNSPQIFNTTLTNPGGVPGTIFPGNVQAYDPLYRQPYSQQWSFGVEHQFNPETLFSLAYVGSKGTDLQLNRNINQPLAPANGANINTVVPYRGWGNIGWYQNSVSSNYNSLQASLRFSSWHGLTSGVSYTWSHCLDYRDGDVGGFIQNAYNVGSEYGNCGFDIRQDLIFNYVYDLPFFSRRSGIERSMLGGWRMSGITTLSSGLPLTIGFPGDPAECGCGGYRADVIGDPNQGAGIHSAAEWFNTAAFAAIPAGQFGNGARNIVYGDGVTDWDVSLFKDFTGIPFPGSKEGATFQLRFEFFNLFNTPQFNGYFTTFGQTSFGKPNSTRDPREIQLGAQFMF